MSDTIHYIPTYTRYESQPNQHSDFVIKIKGERGRLGVGFIHAGQSARQVTGGPLVEGPWGYTFGLAVVIDKYGGSGAEAKSLRERGLEIDAEYGDWFIADGQLYELTPGRKYQTGPSFVAVSDDDAYYEEV